MDRTWTHHELRDGTIIDCWRPGLNRGNDYQIDRQMQRTVNFTEAGAEKIEHLMREPRFQLRRRLEDGEMVVFDNRRTLHGRTGFTSQRHPRHLQGCYLTRDSVLSNLAVLERLTNQSSST